METSDKFEFSRPIAIDVLDDGDNQFDISADDEERQALARRFDILSIERLEASLRLVPGMGGIRINLHGTVTADIHQACVITLKPVSATIEATFERAFGPQDSYAPGAEIMISPDEDDPPDPIYSGTIDVGEVVAEELSLELNPFPRSADAAFDGYSSGGDGQGIDEPIEGPFARLADLKKK
jgi:uncharacterized metal-binding protein YceD (DUF177 family)